MVARVRRLRPAAVVAVAVAISLAAAAAAAAAAPQITAPAAFLLERDNGDTVFAHNAHQRRLIASTTKLMTALVVLGRESLDRRMRVAYYPATPGESTIGLAAGQWLTVRDLLRAMLLASANEAAFTLAVDTAGSLGSFVASMNAHARRLGLHDTHYSTPVGLDQQGNYSSAADLAKLATALLPLPFFAATVRRPSAVLPSDGDLVVSNRNDLVGSYPWVVGVKTGHTSGAGFCLVGAASRDGVNLVSVVLGDPSQGDTDVDTLALLRYGFALYHRVHPVLRGQVYAHVLVAGPPARPPSTLSLIASRTVALILRRGAPVSLDVRGLPAHVVGPLAAGTRLGTLRVRERGRVLASVPLISRTAVAAPSGPTGPTGPAGTVLSDAH